jgi:L-ascorbate metabolism protein UlaG (beta-lactamase superfamily)
VRITKYGHACVRIEQDGRVLVVDPGVWSEPEAVTGADAVLITHEHADHVDPEKVRGLRVYAPAGALLDGVEAERVEAGDVFSAAGFAVRALGGRHALIHGGQPDCANLGYLVDDRVYHPGDSMHVPEQPVETLLVPVAAPWLKLAEAIDFVQAIRPERSFAIHDAQLNERGLASVNGWLAQQADGYRYLAPGESL